MRGIVPDRVYSQGRLHRPADPILGRQPKGVCFDADAVRIIVVLLHPVVEHVAVPTVISQRRESELRPPCMGTYL